MNSAVNYQLRDYLPDGHAVQSIANHINSEYPAIIVTSKDGRAPYYGKGIPTTSVNSKNKWGSQGTVVGK